MRRVGIDRDGSRADSFFSMGFRVPFVPVFPLIGAALCVYLMTKLDAATWARFGIWLAVGLVIYFAYGRRHSRLRADAGPRA